MSTPGRETQQRALCLSIISLQHKATPHLWLDFKWAASPLDSGVMNRKSERRDTAQRWPTVNHANPIILVTDPQTSTTTHWHALIFIRSLVKERMKTTMKHNIKKPMSSFQRDAADLTPQQWGRSGTSGNLSGREPTSSPNGPWVCTSVYRGLFLGCYRFKLISLKWCYLLWG